MFRNEGFERRGPTDTRCPVSSDNGWTAKRGASDRESLARSQGNGDNGGCLPLYGECRGQSHLPGKGNWRPSLLRFRTRRLYCIVKWLSSDRGSEAATGFFIAISSEYITFDS